MLGLCLLFEELISWGVATQFHLGNIFHHPQAAAIDTGESFWYAKLSEDIAKKAKSGLKAIDFRGVSGWGWNCGDFISKDGNFMDTKRGNIADVRCLLFFWTPHCCSTFS